MKTPEQQPPTALAGLATCSLLQHPWGGGICYKIKEGAEEWVEINRWGCRRSVSPLLGGRDGETTNSNFM